jgi:type IV pilus assembly protein PilE
MKIKLRGFTLIELMITVAIVGILASIAYPSYMEQIRKGKRADAKAALTSFANAMEIYKMQNGNSYVDAGTVGGTPANSGAPKSTVFPSTIPISGGTPTYNLAIAAIPPLSTSTYTIIATPVDSSDPCGTFKLTNNGVQTVTGSGTDCW